MRLFTMATAPIAAAACVSAAAAGELGDVLILPDPVSGKVRTGAFDDGAETIVSLHQRVFAGEFGEADPLQPNFSDEPGFRGLASDFPDGSSWSFNITGAVSTWNGADFSGASPYTMTLKFGPAQVTTGEGFVSGFSLPVLGSDGFDDHLSIFLDAPTDSSADGIYLLRMELGAPGFAFSDEIWIVLNRGIDDAVFDQAIDAAFALVPAPGAGAALLAFGMFSARRRRARARTAQAPPRLTA